MVKCQEISFAVSHYCKHHQYPHQTQASSIIQLLLILSGSVEINPGLRAPRFPCGECHKAVSIDPSIACDNCHQCFHESCINMNTIIFETYQDNTSIKWLCCSCGLSNVAIKLFETTNSSIFSVSSISQHPVCFKAKSLCILTANFQRLWNKKDEVETFVLDIDIVIGLESHLHQGIINHDFLPYGYPEFQRDHTNRWVGVLLITKNKFICEQIRISEGTELVSIKI